MLKYQGDNITYGYLVDKRQIKLAKFDEHHNFVCEIMIETATKSITTKLTTADKSDDIQNYVKEKLLDDESE